MHEDALALGDGTQRIHRGPYRFVQRDGSELDPRRA